MKTSHTSPTISTDLQRSGRGTAVIPDTLTDESPDTDFPTSWDETQQRLESCGTHSYIEETGCLQNTRSAASFYTKLDQLTLLSGLTRTQVTTHIHPPAPSLCLHSSETQESPALPLPCTRVSQTLDVMSELHKKKAGMGLIECSSDFEAAWKASDPSPGCNRINPYAVTDNNLPRTTAEAAPQTNQTSLKKPGSPKNQSKVLSSSPAILHLPLHCQTQTHGRASWDMNGSHQGSFLNGNSAEVNTDSKLGGSSPTAEERNGMIVIRSTDRAVFSGHMDTNIISESSAASVYPNSTERKETFSAGTGFSGGNEGVEIACEVTSSEEKKPSLKAGSHVGWFSSGSSEVPTQTSKKDNDSFFKPRGTERQEEDQIIEVDGWCHLPRFPVQTSKPANKAVQTWWGLAEAEVRIWGAQILLALESLHQQGVLCRDLNPRNILLTSNGENSK